MRYEIEEKDLEDRYVATVRVITTADRIGATYGEALPEVDADIVNDGVLPTGPPFALYHAYHEDFVDMEVGFPLPRPIETSGRVFGRELMATFAAATWHHGPYDSIGKAHRAVELWLHEERKEISGPPWEVYWTGPADDPDPAKWRTEVGYPFR
jgi:effector-binding domain-containing protein